MSEECHGFTNWATWNVDLWIDNVSWAYNAKVRFLEGLDHPPTAGEVKRFVKDLGAPSDLKASDWKKVDWEDLAEQWEDERQCIISYVDEMWEDFEEVEDDGSEDV